MKLELKHLAPYLPYRLKRHCPSSNVRIHDYTAMEFTQETCDRHQSYGWKPILRPLSDLTKEIEYNVEKFVFSDIYFSNSKIEKLQDKSLCLFENPLNEIDYNSVQTLIKYHFDVFGLIEKGLAIDINTLSVQNDG